MNNTETKCKCGGKIAIIEWCSEDHSKCDHCCDGEVDCLNKTEMVKCLKCGEQEEKEIE